MHSIKALFFMLSLIAVQLSVKTSAQTAGCGGTYSNLSGTISSPNYPSNYDNNLYCSYKIDLPSNQTSVNITFKSFDLGNENDWLLLKCLRYDQYYIPSQSLGPSTLPPLLSISSCPTVELLLETRNSSTHRGFSLEYDIGNGMKGGLTMKPMNSYVRRDKNTTEPTILSCSSRANQTDAYPWWSYSKDGCSFFYVTSSNCSVLPSIYNSKSTYFTTSTQYSTRSCNLAISAQYINDAVGFYTCTDATLDFAFALVDSIDFDFTVVDFSSVGTEVVQGDQVSLTCSVRLHHVTSICFQLMPSVYIYSGDNESLIAISNSTDSTNSTASINVTASAEVLPSYVCRVNFTFKLTSSTYSYPPSYYATNMPENISSTKTFPPVLYWPEITSMVIYGDDNGSVVANGILTCYVPANPPAIYRWTTQEYNFTSGPAVTVSHNGTYTCTASNTIRGKPYEVSKSINITITMIATPEPCENYQFINMADGFRSSDYDSSHSTIALCDANIDNGTWYRFEHISGNRLIKGPIKPWYCGTEAPIWLNGDHPTGVIETTVQACAAFDTLRICQWRGIVRIRLCSAFSERFYIYRLPVPPGCPLSYCVDAASRGSCTPPEVWISNEYRCGAPTSAATTTSPATIAPNSTFGPGGWSRWEPWSECSSQCGVGLHTRRRLCAQSYLPCDGQSTDVMTCSSKSPCEVVGNPEERNEGIVLILGSDNATKDALSLVLQNEDIIYELLRLSLNRICSNNASLCCGSSYTGNATHDVQFVTLGDVYQFPGSLHVVTGSGGNVSMQIIAVLNESVYQAVCRNGPARRKKAFSMRFPPFSTLLRAVLNIAKSLLKTTGLIVQAANPPTKDGDKSANDCPVTTCVIPTAISLLGAIGTIVGIVSQLYRKCQKGTTIGKKKRTTPPPATKDDPKLHAEKKSKDTKTSQPSSTTQNPTFTAENDDE